MRDPRRRPSALARTVTFLALLSALALHFEITPRAFNYVIDVNGTYWGIQDDDSPRVDTGSIRATQVGPGGQNGAFSTVDQRLRRHQGPASQTTPAPHLNGELMRGFGLTFDGVNRFTTTQSVDLGGVVISRAVYVNTARQLGPLARHLHQHRRSRRSRSRSRSAASPGIGTTGGNASAIVTTSSGDAIVTAADAWVEYATPLSGATLVGAPAGDRDRHADRPARSPAR